MQIRRMTQIDPAVRDLRIRMMDAGLKPSEVRYEAEVGRATWYRMCKGEDFAMSTLRRMEAAVETLTAARRREIERASSDPASDPTSGGGAGGGVGSPDAAAQAGS